MSQSKITRSSINRFFNRMPLHLAVIGLMLIWLIPTIGLLVTSLRPVQSINTNGWWMVMAAPPGMESYNQYCGECHGPDGSKIETADLSDPAVIEQYPRSIQLLGMLRQEIDGQPHMGDLELPSAQEAADIAAQLKKMAGGEVTPRLTLNNYIDALVGYRGTNNYVDDCEAGAQAAGMNCNISDLLNPRGMGRAFINSLIVTIPATILPILFAAFAGYAFAWLDFKGRYWLFAILVGLQVIPLQMTLVPISRLYAQLGLNGTFWGVWLFHTGFGMPYSIYLMRNFLGTLPRDLFERSPELFRADDKGVRLREWNLCVHSQQAMEIVAANAVDLARVLRPTTGRYFYWGDDGCPWCRCRHCAGLSDSEQSLLVANRILDAVRSVDPKAQVAHLAYDSTLPPPRQVKPKPGIFSPRL